jgi:hypothetical protein
MRYAIIVGGVAAVVAAASPWPLVTYGAWTWLASLCVLAAEESGMATAGERRLFNTCVAVEVADWILYVHHGDEHWFWVLRWRAAVAVLCFFLIFYFYHLVRGTSSRILNALLYLGVFLLVPCSLLVFGFAQFPGPDWDRFVEWAARSDLRAYCADRSLRIGQIMRGAHWLHLGHQSSGGWPNDTAHWLYVGHQPSGGWPSDTALLFALRASRQNLVTGDLCRPTPFLIASCIGVLSLLICHGFGATTAIWSWAMWIFEVGTVVRAASHWRAIVACSRVRFSWFHVAPLDYSWSGCADPFHDLVYNAAVATEARAVRVLAARAALVVVGLPTGVLDLQMQYVDDTEGAWNKYAHLFGFDTERDVLRWALVQTHARARAHSFTIDNLVRNLYRLPVTISKF